MFPSFFAYALVPIYPGHWPAFSVGSAITTESPADLSDRLKRSFDNLVVAKEYLETSQSDIQWLDRFWKLTQDTMTINSMCYTGELPGIFAAGAYSNCLADEYMNEMVETMLTLNEKEKYNNEMFKQMAVMPGEDPDSVRVIGLCRENVPPYMRSPIDIRTIPERFARPDDNLSSGSGSINADGIIYDPTGSLPNNTDRSSFQSTNVNENFFQRCFSNFGFSPISGGISDIRGDTLQAEMMASPLFFITIGTFGYIYPTLEQ